MTVFMSNHALAHLKSITCCSTGRIHACKTVTSNLMYTDAEMSHTSKVKPMKTFGLDAVHATGLLRSANLSNTIEEQQ